MVLSCLRSYHLRCLRPSLLLDSEPLVERDEIIAVLQNLFSLFLCPFLPSTFLPFVSSETRNVLFETNNYRNGRFCICTLGVIGDAFCNECAFQTRPRRRTVISINIHKDEIRTSYYLDLCPNLFAEHET